MNTDVTLPYEWWGEKVATSISFENLTLQGTGNNQNLDPYQSFFEELNFTVKNCVIVGLKIHDYANVPGTITIQDNVFNGSNLTGGSYAIHIQGYNESNADASKSKNINISGNTISGYPRGINIDQKTAVATINNNTIMNLKGVTENGNTYGSAVQITQGSNISVTGNTIDVSVGNAIHFHNVMANNQRDCLTISNKNIKAPYLLWNVENLDQSKITSSGNTLDIANPGKAMTKIAEVESTTVINGTIVEHPTTIVIITPSEDTPKTDDQKNPSTGANDMVAAAVAIMAVSALGMAVLTRKK